MHGLALSRMGFSRMGLFFTPGLAPSRMLSHAWAFSRIDLLHAWIGSLTYESLTNITATGDCVDCIPAFDRLPESCDSRSGVGWAVISPAQLSESAYTGNRVSLNRCACPHI